MLVPLTPTHDPAKPGPSMGKAALESCQGSSDQVPDIGLL